MALAAVCHAVRPRRRAGHRCGTSANAGLAVPVRYSGERCQPMVLMIAGNTAIALIEAGLAVSPDAEHPATVGDPMDAGSARMGCGSTPETRWAAITDLGYPAICRQMKDLPALPSNPFGRSMAPPWPLLARLDVVLLGLMALSWSPFVGLFIIPGSFASDDRARSRASGLLIPSLVSGSCRDRLRRIPRFPSGASGYRGLPDQRWN